MATHTLRAVQPDDKSPVKLTVAEAAATGDQLATLIAIRDRVATAISDPKCSHRDLASLTKRLDDVIEKIKTIDTRSGEAADLVVDVDDGFDAAAI